jgi:hypothetical protein
VRELQRGLRWSEAVHPEWTAGDDAAGRDWKPEVSSYAVDDGRRLLLIDPTTLLRPHPRPRGARPSNGKCCATVERMTIERMEHVGIVVDDLAVATAFFVELGLALQGEGQVEGGWVNRVVGLEDVRVEYAMLETRTATDGSSW